MRRHRWHRATGSEAFRNACYAVASAALADELTLDGETLPRGQLLLFAALPPAVMQFMLAERYHQEPDKVGAMIMLGNALAILFVPLALALGL